VGPFDRFNDRAKRVLALAQDEAVRLNHNYIGTEHLLLGLVREGQGVAAMALASLGVELNKARTAVQFMLGRGNSPTAPSDITLSPHTKKVIELALDEARKLEHGYVGTEHLLLGLVREGGGIASGVLESLGVSAERVRHQVIATLGQEAPSETTTRPEATPSAAGPFEGLDEQAALTMARAYWEAGRLNKGQLGPEHLLLALARSESPWIRRAWKELAIDPDKLADIGSTAPPREVPRLELGGQMPLILYIASRLAAERRSPLIRPEHLLLAITYVPESTAGTLLAALGATPQVVREAIDKQAA
jgi:ATP-dependent Clp protease ATP-binding subunit ClpA